MRVDTRFVCLSLIFGLILIAGCSGGGDKSPVQPVDHAPTVIITSGPYNGATINPTDNVTYVWQGSDEDGNLKCYYAGLDGNLDSTVATTMTFSGLTPGSSHTFSVYAVDMTSLHSTTAARGFNVAQMPADLTLPIGGQGLVDADNDLFWTQYRVNWSPRVALSGQSIALRLVVGIRPQFGGVETLDSSELVNRSPGEDDTLYLSLPTFTKNYYNIRAELHGANGATLINIPYDSIASLTGQGLEDIDGYIAWVASADTANGIDTVAPLGYFESIDLRVDVDTYGDPANIKLVLYERSSAEEQSGLEHSMSPIVYGFNIQGSGPEDAMGWTIHAESAPDEYDYRVEVRDQNTNQLLTEVNYGNPALTNIPLGIITTAQQRNRAERILK